MPSTSIPEESVLFTPYGWRITKNLPPKCQILFINRHGRFVETTVQLLRTEKQSRLAYIGTGAAIAALVADTRLLANDGKKWMVKDLIERDVSSVYFETPVRIPDVVQPKPSVDDLWQCLSEAAAVRNSESIALHCRDPLFVISTKFNFLRKKETGGQTFAIVTKQELAKALDKNWGETITTLTTAWLRNADDGRIEVERSAYYLALWFSTALIASGSGYSFQFDTLQHSSYIFVTTASDAPRPLQRGACAFFTPHGTCAVSLSWGDRSLTPITGGFLLAAD